VTTDNGLSKDWQSRKSLHQQQQMATSGGGLNIISRHTFLSSFHHFLIWFSMGKNF
jgi:hypothetical protein